MPKGYSYRQKTYSQAPGSERSWVLPAVLGGVLTVGGIVVVLILARGNREPERQLEEDRQSREQAAPVNKLPPVPWTLKPMPGPKLEIPDHLAVKFPDRFAWEVFLPGSGPEYLSVEPVPGGGRAVHFGRFDLKTGLPVGPSTRLKGEVRSFKQSAVSPNGTLAHGFGTDGLLQ